MLDVVGLHGFTQRGAALAELEWFLDVPITSPDLPGHGGEPVRSWEDTIDHVAGIAASRPHSPILAGYSMGGRISLGVALKRPEVISGLAMISAACGIADPALRARRVRADHELAERIEVGGLAGFLDEWSALPMFSGLARRGPEWNAADREMRLTNTAPGLSGALRNLGQGRQPDYLPRLGELTVPVLLIVGEQDARYRRIAERMASELRQPSILVVRDAGHPVVGERPESVAEAILAWAGE